MRRIPLALWSRFGPAANVPQKLISSVSPSPSYPTASRARVSVLSRPIAPETGVLRALPSAHQNLCCMKFPSRPWSAARPTARQLLTIATSFWVLPPSLYFRGRKECPLDPLHPCVAGKTKHPCPPRRLWARYCGGLGCWRKTHFGSLQLTMGIVRRGVLAVSGCVKSSKSAKKAVLFSESQGVHPAGNLWKTAATSGENICLK